MPLVMYIGGGGRITQTFGLQKSLIMILPKPFLQRLLPLVTNLVRTQKLKMELKKLPFIV